METVAFYSYKGGVGRTLLVANTAQFLALSGRRVVALDLDLEAPGLHHKLWNPTAVTTRGAVDELLAALEGEQRDRSLRDAAIEVQLPSGSGGSLFLIPAGSAPSPAYWAALERLNHALRAHRRNGGLPEAVLELQARIAEEFDPEFLLIDSRTGITELGGLATSLLADRVICLMTTSPESVEGIRVVADALRAAPRLASQEPLRIEFLLTRVENRLVRPHRVAEIFEEFEGSITILPHDPGLANGEQVWRRSRPHDPEDAGMSLFQATLGWIAKAFPGHEGQAAAAQRRMWAVCEAWLYLTRGGSRSSPLPNRSAWPLGRLREGVRFGWAENCRQADIVAYDLNTQPLMIIEFVDDDGDPDAAAGWWFSETQVPVVAVFDPYPPWRLYSREHAPGSGFRLSNRRDLPLPRDFEALPDPTDVSVGALLDAARRGYPEYLRRIVDEQPIVSEPVADEVVDGLACLDDIELARQALEYSAFGVVGQEVNGLFPQLFWRLPPEASIQVAQQLGHCGTAVAGTLALLAQETLGLRYQPDAIAEGGAEVRDPGTRSISFEISTASPEMAVASGGVLGEYRPGTNEVVLYSQAIKRCAGRLALRARHVGSVTLIHQTLRALARVGRDLDGRMWPESELTAKAALVLEALIHYFTHQHLVRLRDPKLLRAWETLTDNRTPVRRTWKPILDLSAEDARSLFMEIRRGEELAPRWRSLYDAMPEQS
jgi:MinD-like ATPase involved in chromosome partitioning or flagellar assembly